MEKSFPKLVNECVPSKEITVRTDDKPWYDAEIIKKKILDIGIDLEKKAVKSKIPLHWQVYKATRNKVNNLKKHVKEKNYNNLEQTLTESVSSNKRDFWKIVRHFVKGNKSSEIIPPLTSIDENNQSQMHYTDHEKVECLNSYFTCLFDNN